MDLVSNLQTTLDVAYTHDTSVKIEVDSVTNFPADGVVRIDDGDEWVLQRYDVVDVPNKELETLTDPKAIFESTGAVDHEFAIGTTVTLVFTGDYLDEIAAATPVLANGTVPLTANWDAGAFRITAETFESDIPTGNPPFVVASTTVVPNLNADMVDGEHFAGVILAAGTVPLTAAWDAGSWQIQAETFKSDIVTGTEPFTVASTTVVPSLNVDMVDGKHSTDLVLVDGTQALTANWDVGAFDVRVQNLTADALGAGLIVYTGTAGLLSAEVAFAYNAATNVATIPTIDLTGGQIAFPAGVQVSADPHTLDDYEEGTWTITWTCATNGTVTLTALGKTGAYTKVGNLVHVQGYIEVDAIDAPQGTAQISLPFTSVNIASFADRLTGSVMSNNMDTTRVLLNAYIGNGVAYFTLYSSGDAVAWVQEDSNILSGNEEIYIGFSYITA